MTEYTVKVDDNSNKFWYLNGKELTEEEFNNRQASCDGKEVVIDGKTYTLVLK